MSLHPFLAKDSRMPLKVVIGYALGEFGFSFFLIFIAYYLMYFLTDVLMMETTKAAIVFSLCQVFETITVILAGLLINHSKMSYRAWMLSGAVLCFAFTSLLFTKLPLADTVYPYFFSFVYFIAYWGYNLMWISYRSLLGSIGTSPRDVVVLSTTGFQFGTIAALLFSYLGIKVLTAYGQNPAIYGINAFAYCAIMVVSILAVFSVAKPYDKDKVAPDGTATKRASFKDLRYVCTGPMIPFFLSVSLRSAVPVMLSSLMIYFLRLVIKNVSIMPIYVLILSIAALLGATLAKHLSKGIDKRRLYVVSGLANGALLVSMGFFGTSTVGFILLVSLNSFIMYIGNVLIPSFMNDISEYNNYKHKTDIRAFTFSVGRLSVNASQIIGSSIASFGLVLFGYDTHHDISEATIVGIRSLMSFIPAILVLAGVGLFLFYKLDDKTMESIRND